MKKTYVFLHLKIRNGEYEYDSKTVHELSNGVTPETFPRDYASEFYGEELGEERDNGWYFNGGEVHVSIKNSVEIQKAEYEIMRKYL